MNLIDLPKIDWDAEAQLLTIADNFASTAQEPAQRPEEDRITVLLDLPHLANYGRETTVELVYGCNFPVALGDAVSCPPTPRFPKRTTGIVTALNGGTYRGPVKYVRKVAPSAD